MKKIGLISDTHGLLRPEVLPGFAGVDMIIHAGDIGGPDILRELEKLAPVHVVRGNTDTQEWAYNIDYKKVINVEEKRIYVLHNIKELNICFPETEPDIVIFGHSHKPLIKQDGKLLYVNPGSAGPRRFSLPVSIGMLTINSGKAEAGLISLLP